LGAEGWLVLGGVVVVVVDRGSGLVMVVGAVGVVVVVVDGVAVVGLDVDVFVPWLL
jgi:hypothetical protein